MRDSGPGPSGIDAESPDSEGYFHIDVYCLNRFGQAVGDRLARMTRFPMVESECRVMVRNLTKSCPVGMTYALTKARSDD